MKMAEEETVETEETTKIENTETVTETDESGEIVETETTPDTEKKGGIEKKFGKLTSRAKVAEQRAAKAEADMAYYKGLAEGKATTETTTKKEKTTSVGLNPADFETYEEYLDARDIKIRKEVKAEILGEQEEKEKEKTAQTVQVQFTEARKKYKDFDEVALSNDHSVTEAMVQAAQGEHYADILHVLGKDHDLSARISLLPPLQAAREIGKIEERIMNPKKPIKKTDTSAPDPIETLGGGGNSDATPIDKMPFKKKMDVWEAKRKKDAGLKE